MIHFLLGQLFYFLENCFMLSQSDSDLFFNHSLNISKACNRIIDISDKNYSEAKAIKRIQIELAFIMECYTKMQNICQAIVKD
jgi:hypothetical protein